MKRVSQPKLTVVVGNSGNHLILFPEYFIARRTFKLGEM